MTLVGLPLVTMVLPIVTMMLLVPVTRAVLVFPPGSDIGYILSDSAAELERAQALMPDTDPQYNTIKDTLRLGRQRREGQHPSSSLPSPMWFPHPFPPPATTITPSTAAGLDVT